MEEKIVKIADKIKAGGKNIIFTGAGISTESGIPDYRSQGGIWDRCWLKRLADIVISLP